MAISEKRVNPNRMRLGDEVTMTKPDVEGTQDVVVMDFREVRGGYVHGNAAVTTYSTEVYVQRENGDCEWVPRKWLKK